MANMEEEEESKEKEEIITDQQDDSLYSENGGDSLYPNPTGQNLDIREEKWSIFDFERKIDKGLIISDPDFQRNFVWKEIQKSQFIESIILGLPIPPFYLNVTPEGKYLVVDGRQRTTTISGFLKNKFLLENLKGLPSLNGFNSKRLAEEFPKFQARIEDKQLTLYLIQPSVPIKVVYDIFSRINTNGTQLNKQEVRNCIFLGQSTRFLKKLSESIDFLRAIDYGVSARRMKDREYVLRYIAFRYYRNEYTGDLSDFLDEVMKKLNEKGINEIENIEAEFRRVMVQTFKLFHKDAFRIKSGLKRGLVNIAILESVCLFIADNSDEFLFRNQKIIQSNYKELLSLSEYLDSVQRSTNNKNKVHTRFKLAPEILAKNCI